ncbi:hypothetical protein [Streptomyces chartreusis]
MAGGYRSYDLCAPDVVRDIRMLLAAGLPTRTIREVLPCVEDRGTTVGDCMADRLRDRLTELRPNSPTWPPPATLWPLCSPTQHGWPLWAPRPDAG